MESANTCSSLKKTLKLSTAVEYIRKFTEAYVLRGILHLNLICLKQALKLVSRVNSSDFTYFKNLWATH